MRWVEIEIPPTVRSVLELIDCWYFSGWKPKIKDEGDGSRRTPLHALATCQVVEEGTHEDLLKRGGSYFQLVQCQLSAGEKQTIEAKDAEKPEG